MPSLTALVSVALLGLYSGAAAIVLPASSTPPPPSAPTVSTTASPAPPSPPAVSPSPTVSMPLMCDYAYCDGTSSWCFYWAGVTSYDIFRGPVPGETRVPLGVCGSGAHSSPMTTPTPRSSRRF
ncbi:hypothetical protein HIM_01791 [Hirsutella minnesotensis 3608]|nr:hypothetical protein HIM_01791 [Hirsutella minnesotensis 3608]